jgi:hypothetical protein
MVVLARTYGDGAPIILPMGRRTSTTIRKVEQVQDISGRELSKGDTVTTLSGDLTGRVCDMAIDSGAHFVLLRPAHQPYGPGIWHPADQVNRVALGRIRKRGAEEAKPGPRPPVRKLMPRKK